jgi:hypothetical protein
VSTHIPGPWRLDHDGILMSIVDQRQRVLADVFYGGRGEAFGDGVGEANGHLMAAAPDLLEALRGVLEGGAHDGECDNLDSEGRHKGACIKHLVTARQRENAARAAIAKAEGK